ncbi:hypothetical protein ACFSJU_07775 [Paradesertivirga mongoliensis]|uniref:Uncharacterized protein n=1 Tax=Paradesertivirga mongoliensis TaxID=2100740 RepID=A0ABW4ZJP9_9SPHI|nr:hypothetical protein [Pedobacter mongoliensis]
MKKAISYRAFLKPFFRTRFNGLKMQWTDGKDTRNEHSVSGWMRYNHAGLNEYI